MGLNFVSIVLCFAALCTSSATIAEEVTRSLLVAGIDNCHDNSRSQNELAVCLFSLREQGETVLADAIIVAEKRSLEWYNSGDSLTPNYPKNLKDSQSQWEEYARTHCNFVGLFWHGGSGQTNEINRCYIRAISNRVDDLKMSQ